jgi:predicted RNA binding protein YcfA (HicA-like mRNA interferase family)
MPRLFLVTAPALARAQEKEGFLLSRSKGSHRIYHQPETGKRVVLPYHSGRTIPPGTLANTLREAGIDRDRLQKLLTD